MADEDMSPLHRKKPCRACRDFKSWMNQGNRNKSTMVRSLDHYKIKRIRAITYLKEEHHHHVKEKYVTSPGLHHHYTCTNFIRLSQILGLVLLRNLE